MNNETEYLSMLRNEFVTVFDQSLSLSKKLIGLTDPDFEVSKYFDKLSVRELSILFQQIASKGRAAHSFFVVHKEFHQR